ncbi:hypothetical protein P3T36_006325 [Kitasatospora sp. MAP12-15]|uniref:DUF6247 family protein n=1 Tax=unclassified Kitasatospora TaxID=2633591 RepID=UPI0024743FEE|nr:DUF6247 family protein [Kitasatospora sp. MAP12-44]MDH6107866.1 hypothetical protein [Kitasatospora sp. MAP12-44]
MTTTEEDQVTVQPDHQPPAAPRPATLRELRTALSRYGLPGDRDAFEQALQAALDESPIGDLGAVADVISEYRHRLVLRTDPEAMAALAAPIGGRQWNVSTEVFARLRAGGDR